MVVCLDLSIQIETHSPEISNIEGSESFTAKEFYALQVSQQIWAAKRSSSPQSDLASRTLDLMIRKVTERETDANIFDGYDIPPHDEPCVGSESPYIIKTMSDIIDDMIDDSEAIDWSFLDQFFQAQVMKPTS